MPEPPAVTRANAWKISRLTGEFLDADTESLYFVAEVQGKNRIVTEADEAHP